MTKITFGHKKHENGALQFLPEAIPLTLAAANKARKADGEKPITWLSFDGKTAIHAKTVNDLLKLGCCNSVILTPGTRELSDFGARCPQYLTATGYWLAEDGYSPWHAFLRSKPITEDMESLTAYWQPESIEEHPPIDPWLQRAVSHDAARPEMCHVAGNIATDGRRMHYRTDLKPIEWLWRPATERILAKARENSNLVCLTQGAAIQLLTVCRLAKKLDNSALRLSVNGRLEYTIRAEGLADTSGTISAGYEHAGEDITVGINAAYLADALGKPGKETWIALGNLPTDEIYLTDGETHEAVIKPLDLS